MADESLRLVIDQYKAGTVSYLNVITSQTILLGNQRTAVSILQRQMAAAVQLISALGGGWNTSHLPTGAELRSSK